MKRDIQKMRTKEYLAYCDIYGDVFHILGFKEEQRGLAKKLTDQCIKTMGKYKNKDFNKILKAGQD